MTNDDDLSAVFVYLRDVCTVCNLPGDFTIARAAVCLQGKLIPVGDGIGLIGNGQRRLLL